MAYFILKIDQRLSKYFEFLVEPETFKERYNKGCLLTDYCYKEDYIMSITHSFSKLTCYHKITEHNENLLFLTIKEVERRSELIATLTREYELSLRHKELAIVLQKLLVKRDEQGPSISIKSNLISHKINDTVLSDWICDLILKTMREGEFEISKFGKPRYLCRPLGQINICELEKAATTKIQNVTTFRNKLFRDLNAQFCFALLPYINNETILATDDERNFSDGQLRFLYDLMLLFNLITDREYQNSVDYESKDYLRATLITYAKQFIVKGKKSEINS